MTTIYIGKYVYQKTLLDFRPLGLLAWKESQILKIDNFYFIFTTMISGRYHLGNHQVS
jgi:hypothetical protein